MFLATLPRANELLLIKGGRHRDVVDCAGECVRLSGMQETKSRLQMWVDETSPEHVVLHHAELRIRMVWFVTVWEDHRIFSHSVPVGDYCATCSHIARICGYLPPQGTRPSKVPESLA
jgi:hypothetical protein